MADRPNVPIPMIWDGERMTPPTRYGRLADRQFVIGESYLLIEHHERSHNSHAHYFASLNEAWQNLPEGLADRFPTVEHLRKYALIKAGFADERSIVCASRAEAVKVAAFIRPVDTYAVVTSTECVVRIFTAQSQSMRAMGKADFQRSKTAVLEIVAGMLDVEAAALAEHARAA